MGRCVIVGGAPIEDYSALREYLQADDFYIFCDCGLKHAEKLGVQPDLIVGDFDSYEKPETDTEIIVLPHIKDDTDTVFAAKEGIKRGFGEFLLVGAVGARFDHTMCNISILLMLARKGKKATLIDDYSEMEIVSGEPAYIDDSFPYFSLLNITGTAKGITIENAFYNLTDGEIDCDYQYGVSNEPLPGRTAIVSVKEGELLLVRVKRG